MKVFYLRLAFFGYIFVFFFFKINNIDLLPNVIGYFLVMLALVGFTKENKYAKMSIVLAFILLLLSLVPINFSNDYSILRDSNLVNIILVVSSIILGSICRLGFYKTCCQIATGNGNEKLSKSIDSTSFWFLVFRPVFEWIAFWQSTFSQTYNSFLVLAPLLIVSLLEILYIFKITFIERLSEK